MLHGELQGHFRRRGTAVGEKQMPKFVRHPLAQSRGQFFCGIMREARQNYVLQLVGLPGQSLAAMR
jgi:hypothetical protein